MELPKYPKPTDTLDWFTYQNSKYWTLEIRKSQTKIALVKTLEDWSKKIHLLDDIPFRNNQ